ncbi:MAG: metallophosphoesterase [Spirochaetales bacterium]|nr:metallophosphoesterase [Spirochaetales bacterium]
MPENKLIILYISDLHIKPSEEFDRSVVLDLLLERVEKDRKEGLAPEIVIVSGDIAWKGVKEEYQLAAAFFHDLRKTLELQPENFYIIPGNHDINRKKYRPGDIPVYTTMAECNNELEHYTADLLKGMADYFDFIKTAFPHLKTIKGNLVPFVRTCTTVCGKKIGLVGLNSAWMCRKSPDREEIALGEYQVKHACSELEKRGETDLTLCIFHHPLSWLWREDRLITRHYINKKIVLAGHLHEPGGGFFQDLDGEFYQFQAGGAYLGSESDWPSRYHYITCNWDENHIKLDFRKFDKQRRRWVLDAETGDDGVKLFPFPHTRENSRTITPAIPLTPVLDTYRNWVTENYGTMDATNLYGKGEAYPLSLPEIFIPLYAYGSSPAHKGKKETFVPDAEHGFERQKPVNIETLMAESSLLLIQGDPGSGKTTLLKHFACSAVNPGGKDIPGVTLFHVLPVLIPLKEMKAFFLQQETGTGEDILAWYNCHKMGGILPGEQLELFLKAGKTIILLDGLDECEHEYRDRIVDAFCDVRLKYKGTKVIITSRPHGITGSAFNRCSSKTITILPLDSDHVKLFINRWFAYVYHGSSGTGRKNADAMIREIQDHQAIGNLIQNPLMLTALATPTTQIKRSRK